MILFDNKIFCLTSLAVITSALLLSCGYSGESTRSKTKSDYVAINISSLNRYIYDYSDLFFTEYKFSARANPQNIIQVVDQLVGDMTVDGAISFEQACDEISRNACKRTGGTTFIIDWTQLAISYDCVGCNILVTSAYPEMGRRYFSNKVTLSISRSSGKINGIAPYPVKVLQ